MWTLGYDDNGGEFCFSEPFHGGRKLRPLVPRPLPSLRVNGGNFPSQYYHLGMFFFSSYSFLLSLLKLFVHLFSSNFANKKNNLNYS